MVWPISGRGGWGWGGGEIKTGHQDKKNEISEISYSARRPLKLAMLATNFHIRATICPLVFYFHIKILFYPYIPVI